MIAAPGAPRRVLTLTLLAALALCCAAAPGTALAAFGDRSLHRGSRGSDVRELQRDLTQLGFRTGADGAYGRGTERSVRAFERSVHGRVDGWVSRGEARSIGVRARGRSGAARRRPRPHRGQLGWRTLRRGSQGSDVRELQRDLTRLGFRTGADGAFGRGTDRSVRAFERSVHGRVDGWVSRGEARNVAARAATAGPARTPASVPVPAVQVSGHVFPLLAAHRYGDGFGAARGGHRHQGQDIFARAGSRVVASYRGTVAYRAYQGSGAGNYVVIHGADDIDSVYMHLRSPSPLHVGQPVATGQLVGYVGCTGSCSGNHLHFELWTAHWYEGGHAFDPAPSLRRWDRVS